MTTRSKLGIALLALGISLSAMAMDLGQAMSALGGAKAQGLVGEQADGYLGVVSNSGQAADIAAQINAARRAEYQKVANSSGASLADVEAMAGKKAMERTPAGQYVFLSRAVPSGTPAVFHGFCDRLSRKSDSRPEFDHLNMRYFSSFMVDAPR